jgi:predicted tellurium resistance membrane protein TerC
MTADLLTLASLILLQAVLGIDNLLYISLESRRAPVDQQKRVRWIGIGLAIVLRIALLFVLLKVIDFFKDPFLSFDNKLVHGEFNVHSVIVLVGGAFIIYTAIKEIYHMLLPHADHGAGQTKQKSVNAIITAIVVMNLVFSFDSILAAMALTDIIWVMATAIVISGGLMIWLSDSVSHFLAKNRMFEVLGLFILLVVGIMLLSEGGHLAHLSFGGHPVEKMSKATFYFVIGVLIIIDIVQSRYQKKLLAAAEAGEKAAGHGDTEAELS